MKQQKKVVSGEWDMVAYSPAATQRPWNKQPLVIMFGDIQIFTYLGTSVNCNDITQEIKK